MRKSFLSAAGAVCVTCLIVAAAAQAQNPVLTVDGSQPGVKINPMLYGIFFEEINHAGDGGLYAELIRNRSFDDADDPAGWALQTSGDAQGKIGLATENPVNQVHPKSLQIEISESRDGGLVSVSNNGYWGIAVKKGAKYNLSFFVRRSADFKGDLIVSLDSASSGSIYARQTIIGVGTQWKRYECALESSGDNPKARLSIAANAPGTLWLGVVSLMPTDTWKGRPNGLRADLARMLSELKPAFVRFPGGCYVEGGASVKDAFRWKTTIGDIAQRPGHSNKNWGYRSTDGLGYHEYLEMCEDLNAEPLFVVNCGMAHKDFVEMDKLDEWVQEAIDAIEYANGPETSKWGALRAKNGHPKPFNMKYLEIGNENGGPRYEERYAVFYKAIKARYPDINLIADTAAKSAPIEIVDHHYYNSPMWFRSNAGKYDKYDRKGPKVYVGEYACNRGVGKGNLDGALAEASFMMGFERNSDAVILCSYAPLFYHVQDRRWPVNLIGYDSARCFGTPSFYVQAMLAQQRGDVALSSTLECGHEQASLKIEKGGIGLGTWNTQAEFKDVKVTQSDKVLLSSNFSKDSKGWRVVSGDWKVADGAFRQSSDERGAHVTAGDKNWTDYTMTLKARKTGGAEGFLIMFRVADDRNWNWLNLGGWGNKTHGIERTLNGGKRRLSPDAPGTIETGRWYDITIDVKGARIECSLDGKKIIASTSAAEAQTMPIMDAIAHRLEKTGEIILKVVNFSGEASKTAIRLKGIGEIAPEGAVTVLASKSLSDENTVDEPTKVAPVTKKAMGLGQNFDYTFDPYSLTILRLQPKNK
ncbi:MAG: DUF1080 domain-containing protein [Candidatus Sumerlaeota bacterium]|nr:DUF1080 domain-containing protein [Candidatus Sumerlaeota bacterium]